MIGLGSMLAAMKVVTSGGAVPVVVSMTHAVGNPAGGGTTRRVVQVDSSTGCTSITAGGVAFTAFAIDDATHVSGIPGAHAAGVVDVVVTNATGPSTTGTGLYEYWHPATESLGQFCQGPNYADAGAGTWTATVGTNCTGTAEPNPVAVGGCPDCETTTDFPLGCAVDADVWCGSGDCTFFAVIQLETISRNFATSYQNDPVVADSGGFCGLFLRNNATVCTLYFYQWDGAERKASVDVSALVDNAGAGYLIIQGKKSGGNLHARAIGATGAGVWTVGDACGTLDAGAANFRVGQAVTPDGIVRVAGTDIGLGWSDAISAKFEKWAQAEHP